MSLGQTLYKPAYKVYQKDYRLIQTVQLKDITTATINKLMKITVLVALAALKKLTRQVNVKLTPVIYFRPETTGLSYLPNRYYKIGKRQIVTLSLGGSSCGCLSRSTICSKDLTLEDEYM